MIHPAHRQQERQSQSRATDRGRPVTNAEGVCMTMDVRPAERGDRDRLAEIWHEGWHDGHARVVPPELTIPRSSRALSTST
jgi:hypothetical protein